MANDLEVFVPSRSRPARSITLEALKGHWDHVYLVVPKSQKADYKPLARKHGVTLLACPVDGIAGTRQWIGQVAEDKFLMLDDDLRFYRRMYGEDVSLHKFGKTDMQGMLTFVERFLYDRAHVAISARGGNNQLPYPWAENKRPLRALAYRKREFLECEHGRVTIMEDFDVTLQLIRRGYANVVITEYAQDQPVTQAAGGCSDYRTHKVHADNVKKMAELHAPFVKLRMKENKTGGDFGKRLEATIYWQKAWETTFKALL